MQTKLYSKSYIYLITCLINNYEINRNIILLYIILYQNYYIKKLLPSQFTSAAVAAVNIVLYESSSLVYVMQHHTRSESHLGFVRLRGSFAHQSHLIYSTTESLLFSCSPFGGHTTVVVLHDVHRPQRQSVAKLSWQAVGFLRKSLKAYYIHVLLRLLQRITELSATNFLVLIQAARVCHAL